MRKVRHLIKNTVGVTQPFTQETRLSRFQHLLFIVPRLPLSRSVSYFLGQPGSGAMGCTSHVMKEKYVATP